MNLDQIEAQWQIIKGQFRERFGKLTDDDLQTVAGKKDQLVGMIQKQYAVSKEKAEQDLKEFVSNIDLTKIRAAGATVVSKITEGASKTIGKVAPELVAKPAAPSVQCAEPKEKPKAS